MAAQSQRSHSLVTFGYFPVTSVISVALVDRYNRLMLDWIREIWESEWAPVSRPAGIAWLCFYALFLLYVLVSSQNFLFIDNVNLVIHEGGHLLFSWGGPTLTLYGGTILQWLVPFLLAAYFYANRHTTGFAFSLFFFFENWRYTSFYMADARAQALPLVSVGGGGDEENMHDFYRIFTQLGLLNHDTQIGAVTRALAWIGMLGVVAWLAWRIFRAESSESVSAGTR